MITSIELDLTAWTDHYPTGIIFYSFNELFASEFADTEDEFKHWIDEYKHQFSPFVEVHAKIDPRDIDDSNVIDVVREIYSEIRRVSK